jgi:hypothetical protein
MSTASAMHKFTLFLILMQRNGFYPARFLYDGNGSPDEILSICLAQKYRQMYP